MTTRHTVGSALHGVGRTAARPVAILPMGLAVALVLPAVSSNSGLYVWSTAVVWILFALGSNVLFGWSGMMSFGQAAFLGLGAYSVALLKEHELSPLLLLLIAAAVAAGAGAVFAVIALRTTGVEFAVLTMVFAQVLWLLTYTVADLRGDDGFSGLAGGDLFGYDLLPDTNFWYYLVGVVTLCAWGLRRVELSSFGAVLRAVRDDKLRAASLGLPVRRLQIVAYALSSGVCGIAGALIAQLQGVATPQTLVFTVSGQALVACLLGGAAFWGPAAGAVIVISAENFLFGGTDAPALLTGLLLLIVVLIAPGGLASLPKIIGDTWRRRFGGESDKDPDPPAPDHDEPVRLEVAAASSASSAGLTGELG